MSGGTEEIDATNHFKDGLIDLIAGTIGGFLVTSSLW